MAHGKKHNETELNGHEVWFAARYGAAGLLAELLLKADGESVNKILNYHKEENTTPLMVAVCNGHADVVNLLLSFGADTEQTGTVKMTDNEVYPGVTALWCAAGQGRYTIVKILVKHGADVNYANNDKGTCLMIASWNGYYGTVQYLLENGANPEAVDKWSQTALHLAAKGGHFLVSKLLVETGVKLTKDNDGSTPLMLAATNGHIEIVEYLMTLSECSREDRINAMELLGASCMFRTDCELPKAYHYFEKALTERSNIFERFAPTKSSIILKTKESMSLGDPKMIRDDRLALAIESLLVMLLVEVRCFSSRSGRELYDLMVYIAELLGTSELNKCITLWMCAAKRKQDIYDVLDVAGIMEYVLSMLNDEIEFEFPIFPEMFQKVATEAAHNKYRIHNGNPDFKVYYELDVLACMYLIGLMLQTCTSKNEENQLHLAVHDFIQQKLHLQNGFTPLHMCCSSVTNDNNFNLGEFVMFPNALICQTLVKCGANVNAQNIYNNTPLHIIAKCKISDVEIHQEIIQCLVENGAHFDIRNINDMTAVDVASTKFAEGLIKPHMKLSLKCLSARVIRKHGIQYKGVIPVSLHEFVELH